MASKHPISHVSPDAVASVSSGFYPEDKLVDLTASQTIDHADPARPVRTIDDVIEALKRYEARTGAPVVFDSDFADDLRNILETGRAERRSIWDE